MDATRRMLLQQALGLAVLQTGKAVAAAAAAPGTKPISGDAPLRTLMDNTRRYLGLLPNPVLQSFLTRWPSAQPLRRVAPSTVPVLRWLPGARQAAPASCAELVDAVIDAAPQLAWRRSYSAAETGTAFFEKYGWTELMGLTGPLASEHLACGLLLLGPGVTYPPHRHEAEEIYVPIAGSADWSGGESSWRQRPPGSVVHHASHEPHAMRTGETCMLAVYLWRSDNLAQKSRLDAAQNAGPRT